MIIEAFVLSIIIGFIRGGSLRNLESLQVRCYYLFLLPFLLFGGICWAAVLGGDSLFLPYVKIANIVHYVALLTAIGFNLSIPEMRIIGVGTFLNFLVLTVNGGLMPVSAFALQAAGMGYLLEPERASRQVRHCIMSADTRLNFLGDIIPIPHFESLPDVVSRIFGGVISIGDVLLALAVFMLIQRYMCRRSPVPEKGLA